jgi:hypothetical protein
MEMDMEKFDLKILKYIGKHGSVTKDTIHTKFSKRIQGIDSRLAYLSAREYKYSGNNKIPCSNSSFIEEEFDSIEDETTKITDIVPKNSYHITDFGLMVLQNKSFKLKDLKFSKYFERIVAVAALILSAISLAVSIYTITTCQCLI